MEIGCPEPFFKMFLEIEETVCFITSFLYGKIPKSRTDLFADTLANGLVDRIYTGSRPLKSYCLIVDFAEKLIDEVRKTFSSKQSAAQLDSSIGVWAFVLQAASFAFISRSEFGELLPANLLIEIYDGSVHAVNTDTGHVKCVYPERCCFTVAATRHFDIDFSNLNWRLDVKKAGKSQANGYTRVEDKKKAYLTNDIGNNEF
uniref:DUF4238 domain-containing protein n=1 Tax=Angiostrongylus cantonensis TaxID=6313 RepID=A0A0K0D2C8_ANGCA